MLQRCLIHNEGINYKEILIFDLMNDFKMNENSISAALGQDTGKIKKYMFKQVIPKTYLDRAEKLNIKPFLQAIYLANNFTSSEKIILSELALETDSNKRLRAKHLPIYKRYRKRYFLFEDFSMAKEQILKVVHNDAVDEYWRTIPHPLRSHSKEDVPSDFNELH